MRADAGSVWHAFAPLRVLLPSWRFFDEVAPTLALQARVAHAAGVFGAWQQLVPALRSAPRPLRALFLDAEGNLRLAHYGLLERLQSDLAELPADDPSAEALVSYALVLRLVRRALGGRPDTTPGARAQFRLTASVPGGADGPEVVLCSALHAL